MMDRPRLILKAVSRGKLPRLPAGPPTVKQVEHERELWGPNPIPGHTEVEDYIFEFGQKFLMTLYGAVFGVDTKGREFKKALGDGPLKGPVGWGDLAKLYQAGGDPKKMVDAWGSVLDKLLAKLMPPEAAENAAATWALRTTLLGKVGEKAAKFAETGSWPEEASVLPTLQKLELEQLKWTAAKGGQFLTEITEHARAAVRDELTTGAMEKLPIGKLQQRLFDKFSIQNRDWRRVALTETAFAVQNARLASVDPDEGWDVVWTSSPKACPFCKRLHMKRFRLVSPDKPDKDEKTEIWVGKNNKGRSSSLFKKDGTKRTPAEMWVPCIPAHPNCACQWTLVRAKKPIQRKPLTTVR